MIPSINKQPSVICPPICLHRRRKKSPRGNSQLCLVGNFVYHKKSTIQLISTCDWTCLIHDCWRPNISLKLDCNLNHVLSFFLFAFVFIVLSSIAIFLFTLWRLSSMKRKWKLFNEGIIKFSVEDKGENMFVSWSWQALYIFFETCLINSKVHQRQTFIFSINLFFLAFFQLKV